MKADNSILLYVLKMKQIFRSIVLLTIIGLSLAAVEGITSEQLTEIQASPKIWLVYTTSGIYHY